MAHSATLLTGNFQIERNVKQFFEKFLTGSDGFQNCFVNDWARFPQILNKMLKTADIQGIFSNFPEFP